jgi:hypothetical protein
MKTIFNFLFVMTFSFAVLGCGDAPHWMAHFGEHKKKEDKPNCMSLDVPVHTINLKTQDPIPEKLAFVMNGTTYYDECQDHRDENVSPIVTFQRSLQLLQVKAMYYAFAAKDLPKQISFQITDRGNCTQAPVEFYSQANTPVDFETYYPNPNCSGHTSAETNLEKN